MQYNHALLRDDKCPHHYIYPEPLKNLKLPNGNSDEDCGEDMSDSEYDSPLSIFQQHKTLIDKINKSKFLYVHQKEALNQVLNHPHDTSLVVFPVYADRNVIALLAPYILGASNVVVIAPSAVITKQLHDLYSGRDALFGKLNIFKNRQCLQQPIAVYQSKDLVGACEISRLVIINAKTFETSPTVNIGDIPNGIGLLIVVEAHNCPATRWNNIMKHFCYSRKLFLASTWERHGELGLKDEYIAYGG